MTPEQAQQAAHSADDAARDARAAFAAAVAQALSDGVSGPTLAKRLGLTRQRVYQLRDEADR